jgi:hypothetical protein
MTRIEFIALAESIYSPELGDEWKLQASRDLGVSKRSVLRWVDGSRSVPDIGDQLREIAAERAKMLAAQPAIAKARAKELRAIAATKSQPG